MLEEKEGKELNISKELKENILANPELAIIYANDLNKKENDRKARHFWC